MSVVCHSKLASTGEAKKHERALGFPSGAELGQEDESSSLIQMW